MHIITGTTAEEENDGDGNFEPDVIPVNMAISVNMEGMNGPLKNSKTTLKFTNTAFKKSFYHWLLVNVLHTLVILKDFFIYPALNLFLSSNVKFHIDYIIC